MDAVVLSGCLYIPNEDREAVMQALPLHIRLSKNEEGCCMFDVQTDANNPNKLHVYEVFESRLAFEAHQTRVRQSEWGRVSQNCQREYSVNYVECETE